MNEMSFGQFITHIVSSLAAEKGVIGVNPLDTEEEIMAFPFVLAFLGDNPMAEEMSDLRVSVERIVMSGL
jgi:hypothetical protein